MSQTLKLNATTLANIMNKIVTFGSVEVVFGGNVVTFG